MTQSQQMMKIQYGTEGAAFGTETGSYAELHKPQSCSLNEDNSIIYERGLGEGLNVVKKYWGPYSANGNVMFDVEDFDFLKHWVGPKTGSGTAGSPYILTEATKIAVGSQLEPFSLERTNDTESTKSVETATGCIGTTFTLSGSLNSVLTCSADFIAQKLTEGTAGETFVKSTVNSFICLNGTYKWGSTPSALSGVQNFSIVYTNMMKPDQTRSIESRFINMPHLDGRVYKFSLTILMAQALAATLVTDFKGGSLYPNDGSSSINPTADLEFKIELVCGTKRAYIHLDQCTIDKLSRTAELDGGMCLMSVEGSADEGHSNVPITWWSV